MHVTSLSDNSHRNARQTGNACLRGCERHMRVSGGTVHPDKNYGRRCLTGQMRPRCFFLGGVAVVFTEPEVYHRFLGLFTSGRMHLFRTPVYPHGERINGQYRLSPRVRVSVSHYHNVSSSSRSTDLHLCRWLPSTITVFNTARCPPGAVDVRRHEKTHNLLSLFAKPDD
jgi:hypothetical protein